MGSSNILQFNPSLVNALNDSDYSSNTQRSGGIVDGVAQTALFNKAFSQWGTMAYAIGEALADAGEVVTDSNAAALVASITSKMINSASIFSATSTITTGTAPGASDTGKAYRATSALTFTLPSAGTAGDLWYIALRNDSTGSVTFSGSVNGVTNPIMRPGESGFIYCNGSAFYSVGWTPAYESSGQTLTAAGSLSLSHGLSYQPKNIMMYLVCTSADSNYSIGDWVLIGTADNYSTHNAGLSIVPSSSTLAIRVGSLAQIFDIINKTTGARDVLTSISNWNFVVRAW